MEPTLQELTALADRLESEVGALEREVTRIHDINEMECLIGKYMTVHHRHDNPKLMSEADNYTFFPQREDVTVEVASYGARRGYETLKAWSSKHKIGDPSFIMHGCIYDHNLCTPMIVEAEDGQTAKAVWYCVGFETDPRIAERGGHPFGHPVATWCWGQDAIHFIKADGEWKFYHYHWYRLFRTPFYVSWANYHYPEQTWGAGINLEAEKNQGIHVPSTYHNPYLPEGTLYPVPMPAEPYESYADDTPLP